MDLRLNPKNETLIAQARELARNVLARYATNAKQRFPRESFDALTREGFTRLTLPESYGGQALWSDPVCYAMVFHELSKGCTNTAMTLHMHSSILYFLLTLSDEEQKIRFAEAAANGAIFGSHAGEAASSPQWNRTITTRARKEGDVYVSTARSIFSPWPVRRITTCSGPARRSGGTPSRRAGRFWTKTSPASPSEPLDAFGMGARPATRSP